MLFSEPKIPQLSNRKIAAKISKIVSVLFSEPKIPQSFALCAPREGDVGFSALQRAENSSISTLTAPAPRRCLTVSVLFSEPKIPQSGGIDAQPAVLHRFQCSSASRKFLNAASQQLIRRTPPAFQCSSASRKFLNREGKCPRIRCNRVSVLFSEPKIPQQIRPIAQQVRRLAFQCSSASRKFLNRRCGDDAHNSFPVSVLFSEPKIPQHGADILAFAKRTCFSALQRAENSSTDKDRTKEGNLVRFQCSSASRKFLNAADGEGKVAQVRVSVLFSEPKIPQQAK